MISGFRTAVVAMGAALVAVIGLVFTGRTLHLSREGHVTDRFSKAVEHLGSAVLEVRLGGIYALERLMRDSPRDRQAMSDVLAAFVRERAPNNSSAAGRAQSLIAPGERRLERARRRVRDATPATDVQAALTVLARRPRQSQGGTPLPLDLSNSYLRGANLFKADLEGAVLFATNLEGAFLKDANLYSANLQNAQLDNAILVKANLTLANLAEARLDSADLSKALLVVANLAGASLVRGNLSGARLYSADLRNARLSLSNLFRAHLEAARLDGARLEGANLERAHLAKVAVRRPGRRTEPRRGYLVAKGLTVEQLVTAILYRTRMSQDLAANPHVQARVAEVEAAIKDESERDEVIPPPVRPR
ncbi:pentapeptide repeat-containing protein [Streptomyces sp. NPDC002935]|uniref:pentapeptide repeat-containing protein n=1 Tax=Streptomyces sp. NPDC002935 TaxID=3154545 RepID=UPI0033A3E1A7